ncbi:MAG: Rpn family recombination-promoting nuclease/putative transposase [Candidatus Cardinium sp.]|uniref:Rpn family recombination-promoting nuclease/putative transposase n=1 Tax=Cardinium endosymbiont of Dermatophagoides farinae TaxID=2597823 RepID=UPI0011824E8A|nr:Rpn family recombination-promoting nuclease/putative transposase [Cardinium endosymbiont of Dermatophagoides farinae]TSJ81108.1 Rpn family recombination-promoting nuclease/putative transposase [Cardinium endosymbiont of Dermatophagoides farinae]UWW97150.1 MAG: Rpn family recombination-promoting nuclease/putative transposase [Candidatus Cardinium sp.]
MATRLKHDALVKKILTQQEAAQEFLAHYLPSEVKEKLDLTRITIERESYVEHKLRKSLSDLVYSVRTKDNDQAFVYILIEAEVKPNYWIALKLWQYMLRLCERHKKKDKDKLPLIIPILFYHGSRPFNAPKNLWALFSDPKLAKQLMGGDYKLVDLQSMSDDDIKQKQYVGMLEYVMKHIYQRDMLNLWEEFLQNFKPYILLDKEKGYIYIKNFLWYTDSKLPEDKQQDLERIIDQHLPEQDKEDIMRTIAQKYREEGVQIGQKKGKLIGIQIGQEKGKLEGKLEIARVLLSEGESLERVLRLTGLSRSQLKSIM